MKNLDFACDFLRRIEQESGARLSVYDAVAPILLICVLRAAISRKIGAGNDLDSYLEVSNWLNNMIPEISSTSMESVLDSVCIVAGDRDGILKDYFKPCIIAYDEITHKGREFQSIIESLFREVDWNNSQELFEEAVKMSVSSFRGGYEASNPSIAKLAKIILNVKEGETFSDFVCGLGLSSSIILGDTPDVNASLSDIHITSFAYATIGCFLQNRSNHGKVQDSLCAANFREAEESDKIFIDPPFRAKLEQPFECEGVQIKEASCSAVMKAVASLKEGGVAVITINSGFTYGSQFAFDSIRRYLIDRGYLSAVISLPAMWSKTGVLTTVLVISKKENRKVFMIDLSKKNNDQSMFFYDRRYQALSFTDKGIETICSMIEREESIPEVCNVFDLSVIKNKDYILLPNSFLFDERNEVKTVSEIDEKIEETLGEIRSLLNELK